MSAFNPNRFKTPTFGGAGAGQKAPLTIDELSKMRGGGKSAGPGVGSAMTINQVGGMPGSMPSQQQASTGAVSGAGGGPPPMPGSGPAEETEEERRLRLLAQAAATANDGGSAAPAAAAPPTEQPFYQDDYEADLIADRAAAQASGEASAPSEVSRGEQLRREIEAARRAARAGGEGSRDYQDDYTRDQREDRAAAQAAAEEGANPAAIPTPEPTYDTPESVISEMMRQQKDAQAGVREALRRSQSAARQRGLESQRRAGYSITGGSAGSLGRQYGMDLEDLKIRTENEMRKERTGLWDKLLQERQMQRDLEEGGGSGGGAGGAVPLTPMGRWFNEKRFDTGMNEEELLGEFRGDHKDEAGVARDWTPKERDEIMGMYDQTLPKSGAVGTARTVESFTRAHDQDRFPVTAGGMGDTARNAQGGYNVSFKTMHEGGNEVEIGITSPGSADTRGEHTAVISKEDYMKLKSGAGKLVKKFISRGKFKWVVEDK